MEKISSFVRVLCPLTKCILSYFSFICSLVIISYVLMTSSVAEFIVVNSVAAPFFQGFITPLPRILPSFNIVSASVA